MNINKIEINKILYALYVCTNNDNEIINLEEIKTLLLLVFNSIDQKIENKELLINELKRKLNTYGFYQDNEPIIFKIGDLIKTDVRSLLIELKFVFTSVNGKYNVSIFENDKLLNVINIKE